MAPKNQSINPSTSYGSPHFILLLQEVTWQSRSFLPAGWLKGLCIWKRSRQQLNNLYWVAYKSFICCDCVQSYFEPWTDEASNGEIYFQIKVSHKRKDLVGWLLSFISINIVSILNFQYNFECIFQIWYFHPKNFKAQCSAMYYLEWYSRYSSDILKKGEGFENSRYFFPKLKKFKVISQSSLSLNFNNCSGASLQQQNIC